MSEPTQVRRPWRTTVRTVLAVVAAIAVAAAPHVSEIDWTDTTVIGVVTAVAALITRILADPRVEHVLQRAAPPLAADPDADGRHTREDPPA